LPASSFLWVCKPLMAESTFRVVKSLEKPLEIPVHSLEKGKKSLGISIRFLEIGKWKNLHDFPRTFLGFVVQSGMNNYASGYEY